MRPLVLWAMAPLTDAALTPYHAIKRSLPVLVPGSTEAARNAALTMGAAHAVAPGDDAVASITALTRGRGAEATIDLVGSDETSALGAAVTRSTGHLTIVGIAGGGLPVSFFSPAYEVSVASTYWGTLPELVEVIELARSGHIAAHIERRPLDAAAEGYPALRAGDVEGRVEVVPGG